MPLPPPAILVLLPPQTGGAWDPFAPGATANGPQQQQQPQQPQRQAPPPVDDWGLGELTDAEIWGTLPTKKESVSNSYFYAVRCFSLDVMRLFGGQLSALDTFFFVDFVLGPLVRTS